MPVFLSKITLFGKICLYTILGMVSTYVPDSRLKRQQKPFLACFL